MYLSAYHKTDSRMRRGERQSIIIQHNRRSDGEVTRLLGDHEEEVAAVPFTGKGVIKKVM